MDFLTRLFSAKNHEPAPSAKKAALPQPLIPISLEILNQLFPIRNLGEEELKAFAFSRQAERFETGSQLFQRNHSVEYLFYLLEGIVTMDTCDGHAYEVKANTAKAHLPLCSGKRYTATAIAKTDIQVFRVSPKIMQFKEPNLTKGFCLINTDIPESVRFSRLFEAFSEHYQKEDLIIPSLPNVAVNLRRAVEHSAEIAEAVKIVLMDPAIATKLIHVANSPLYLPDNPISNCHDAIMRLGLTSTRNLVISYSLRQIFQGKNPDIHKIMLKEWHNSVYLASLCHVLASKNDGINAEEAQLAGLIADIGILPFLYFAENFPYELWSKQDLVQAIPHIRAPLGAYVLGHWDFPKELVEIPLLAENWFYDSGPELNLCDIVILSRLHASIGQQKISELPSIHTIPASTKLKDCQLTPKHSLNVLHQAQNMIQQTLAIFQTDS